MNHYCELLLDSTLILDFICLLIFVYLYTEMEFFYFQKIKLAVTRILKKHDSQTGYEQKATVFFFLNPFKTYF